MLVRTATATARVPRVPLNQKPAISPKPLMRSNIDNAAEALAFSGIKFAHTRSHNANLLKITGWAGYWTQVLLIHALANL